jgi:hypothetical protein
MKNIDKLIEQATTTEEYGWGASYEHFDKEKFAKLVASQVYEECVKIAEAEDVAPTDDAVGVQGCIVQAIRERNKGMDNYDDTDAGGDLFFDFLKVVIAIFGFVLFAAALSGILWWITI